VLVVSHLKLEADRPQEPRPIFREFPLPVCMARRHG